MTVGTCVALVELLVDLAKWLEHNRPGSPDIALLCAAAELVTREAISLQLAGDR